MTMATFSNASASDNLAIRPASDAEFALLGQMNRELIEDEGHRNPMTAAQLAARFRHFVTQDGYNVDVLLLDGEIAGYTTHRYEPDGTEPSGRRVFVRQFYIARGKRGGGIGRRAMELLIRTRFADGDRIVLEVMETNPGGKAFWSRIGFAPYSTTMECVVRKS